MDDYDEAAKYVSAANGVEIGEVHEEVARQGQMYAEYMRNLKGNIRPASQPPTLMPTPPPTPTSPQQAPFSSPEQLIKTLERVRGRPLTPQEQSFAIREAEALGEL